MSLDASALADEETACTWARSVVLPADVEAINAMSPGDLMREASARSVQALLLHSGVERFLRLERRTSARLRKELKEQREANSAAVNSQKEAEGRLKLSEEEKEVLQRKYTSLEKRAGTAAKDADTRIRRLETSLKERDDRAAGQERTITEQKGDLRVAAEFGFEECKRAVQLLLAPSIPGGLPDSFGSWNLEMAPLRRGRAQGGRGGTPGSSSHGASGV